MRVTHLPSFALLLFASACSSSPNSSSTSDPAFGGDPKTTDADGGSADSVPLQALPTLSKTTFLFSRHVGASATHLVGYDTTNDQTEVLNRFGENGMPSSGSNVRGVVLSPDRRSIAFTSTYGATKEDVATGSGAGILWTMSVEGKNQKRLTLPIPGGSTQSCTTDLECEPRGMVCNHFASKCAPTAFLAFIDTPTWSKDGQTIYFSLGQSFISEGQVAGGSRLVSASRTTPGPTAVKVTGPTCRFSGQSAMSPDGKSLLVHQDFCGGGVADGLFLVPLATAEAKVVVDLEGISVTSAPVWHPSGEGALFTGSIDLDDGTGTKRNTSALFGADTTTGEIVIIFRMAEGLDVRSVAISPDAKNVVFDVYEPATKRYDLWMRALEKGATAKRLTTDGVSSDPAW